MTTTQELVTKYQNVSDSELLKIQEQIDDYSPEAKQALETVLDERGGINELRVRLKKESDIEEEFERLEKLIVDLYLKGETKNEIQESIQSDLIAKNELEELLTTKVNAIEKERANKKIKPKTIIGGLIGGAIGGTIGGVLWGIQMIYSGYMFYFLGFGLFLLSYAFVRGLTKQSKKNSAVLIISLLSVVYALVLGQLIFEIVGLKGQY